MTKRKKKSDSFLEDNAVDNFSLLMKRRLAHKRGEGKSGWSDKTQISDDGMVEMLRVAIEKGNPIDIANFCMFMQYRCGIIPATGAIASGIGALFPALDDAQRQIIELMNAIGALRQENEKLRVLHDTVIRLTPNEQVSSFGVWGLQQLAIKRQ